MRTPCRRCGVSINVWAAVTRHHCCCPVCGYYLLSRLQPPNDAAETPETPRPEPFSRPQAVTVQEVTRRVRPTGGERVVDPALFDV